MPTSYPSCDDTRKSHKTSFDWDLMTISLVLVAYSLNSLANNHHIYTTFYHIIYSTTLLTAKEVCAKPTHKDSLGLEETKILSRFRLTCRMVVVITVESLVLAQTSFYVTKGFNLRAFTDHTFKKTFSRSGKHFSWAELIPISWDVTSFLTLLIRRNTSHSK